MADAITRDVHEIFGGSSAGNPLAKRFGRPKKTDLEKEQERQRKSTVKVKRPKGLHREVWNLMKQNDSASLPPVMPTDTYQSYKRMRMKVGLAKVTPWIWAPFSNPARKDGALFYHWVKVAEKDAEYPFAKLNRSVTVPQITEKDYQSYLSDLPSTGAPWDFAETQHLLELCSRFDLRFPVIQDRWNREQFPYRSIEDIKERYYNVANAMSIAQTPAGTEPSHPVVFDAEHERRRKEQLLKLLAKTPAEVEEEEKLLYELRKIEQRKRERERKSQDLQRFMTTGTAGDKGQAGPQKRGRKRADLLKASFASGQLGPLQSGLADAAAEPTLEIDLQASLIKFPEFRTAGTYLRSAKLKLPTTVAQRKVVALDKLMEQFSIDFRVPIATEQLVTEYNNLRRDLLLVNDLRETLSSCDGEIRNLAQQYHVENPNTSLPFELSLQDSLSVAGEQAQVPSPRSSTSSAVTPQAVVEPDVTQPAVVPKRKAAMQQGDWLKRLKQK